MISVPVIDMHAHLYESKAIGAWSKEGYDLWEYGPADNVQVSSSSGDLEDLVAAMQAGNIAHAVVVHTFSVDEWRDRTSAGLEPSATNEMSLGERLIASNEWLLDAVGSTPEITAFVSVDPWVLPRAQLADHLADMRERGALGVKIHPVEQRVVISDPRMQRIARLCVELDLAMVSHSGPTRTGTQFAEPGQFVGLGQAVPELRLVVAHFGGARWAQAPALAAACPSLTFDLSEIVAWLGTPSAPSPEQFVRLVRQVGVERVMFGSDFPWYDPGEMAALVTKLPGLTDGELAAVLAENAARLLRLPY